jgi:sugar-specific transcriptional regulator TrmB
MPNEIDTLLERLGLNSAEVAIYKHLVRAGAQRAAVIGRALKIGRTNAYNHLYLLEERGLVTRSDASGVATFSARHPSTLLQVFQRKKQELERVQDILTPAIEQLSSLHELAGGLPGVYAFQGIEGLHAVYDQMLKDGTQIDILQNRPLFRSFLGSYNDHFVKTRRKRKIRSRVLTPDYERIKTDDQRELREVRYLEHQRFPFEMDVKITDHQVALATLKTDNPIGVVISDGEMVRNFRILFEFLWSIGRP